MQDFVDMAEAHTWTLQRLREMGGRLTEQAYQRACAAASGATAEDDEAHARWMLVFDRMARGLRLSMALEAKLARERRRDADGLVRRIQDEQGAPRRSGAASAPAGPRESEREADDEGLPADAPLADRIGRLQAIVGGRAEAEAQPRPSRAERAALSVLRDARTRRAGATQPPDEPWDVLDPYERADAEAPPWRGSG
jgi:hypothetical protein